MDTLSKSDRSKLMSKVKQKNSKIELLVRSFLHKSGFRFRLHSSLLPGHPDIVLPKYHTVIFVNGCFWHFHQDPNCKHARIPKSNVKFWTEKLNRNKNRDEKTKAELISLGWRVLYVWECQLKRPEDTLNDLVLHILSRD